MPSGQVLKPALIAGLEHAESHELDALLAWVAALAHHWPTRFAAALGQVGERALALEIRDSSRHIKLRRIAVARIASAHLTSGVRG